jgi:hypothetical protein
MIATADSQIQEDKIQHYTIQGDKMWLVRVVICELTRSIRGTPPETTISR